MSEELKATDVEIELSDAELARVYGGEVEQEEPCAEEPIPADAQVM
jgi:hypothetical protein